MKTLTGLYKMKTFTQHITERLQLNKDRVHKYEYQPKTKNELIKIIYDIIKQHKDDKIINLNMIDTSEITDMEALFYRSKYNYNISEWDVSRVKNMKAMFENSEFNGDISNWDVSNVENMNAMFMNSKFNNDISQWDVSNVENMHGIFYNSKFNQDLTPWKSKIKDKKQLKVIEKYIK